ncbi:RagB/SusD family nutrient uptake outer membrane protein [Porphyromonas pogonae]|uniref:RagB/SusD family nutrient uptake outer membrane protein n=1 Tax=Porphyromonas pogonae TaxID=867595 RepID=UPI002E795DFB|nr:RagB/SusD family nutrient uptake outer membrane protein [Porphyromonas pogonae]
MKRINIIIGIVASIMMLTSCADRLDLKPEDYYGADNFWNNKGQVEGFMNGVHKDMRDTYSTLYRLGEERGGTMRTGTASTGASSLDDDAIKNNLITKDNTGIGNWGNFYGRILQINQFIEKVQNECKFLSDGDRNHYLGQAYGIRAFYYFWLYRTYGGVVIETEPKVAKHVDDAVLLYKERSDAESTLNFIKEDINKSDKYFEADATANAKILWSKDATKMLKAEIYLWSAKVATGNHQPGRSKDFSVAETALNGVIGKYSLETKFEDIFSSKNKNGKEVIFNIYFDKEEISNWGELFVYAPRDLVNNAYDLDGKLYETDPLDLSGSGLLRHEYKEALVKSFDKEDTRRSGTFLEYMMKPDKNGVQAYGAVIKKLLGQMGNDNKRYFDSNIIIYRYADALLMMAEVQNGLGKSCAEYINQVRKRAYGDKFAGKEYKDGDFATNELTILHERDKEFVAENKRWFDVNRLQDATKKPLVFSAKANYAVNFSPSAEVFPILETKEAYKTLWPLDKGVLNSDPKVLQTPGYDK